MDINPPARWCEADILGLPSWWCGLTAAFGAIAVFLLVFAYLKGRTMLRRRERSTGIRSARCPECDIYLRGEEGSCPRCGSLFDGNRFLCPGCGKEIGPSVLSCPYCGKKLRKLYLPSKKAMTSPLDPDLAKLKERMHRTPLPECPNCGAFLEDKGSCPMCSKGR